MRLSALLIIFFSSRRSFFLSRYHVTSLHHATRPATLPCHWFYHRARLLGREITFNPSWREYTLDIINFITIYIYIRDSFCTLHVTGNACDAKAIEIPRRKKTFCWSCWPPLAALRLVSVKSQSLSLSKILFLAFERTTKGLTISPYKTPKVCKMYR